jgi:hypothetical protein
MLISQMLKDELTPFDATTLRYEVMFASWCSWNAYIGALGDDNNSGNVDALFRSLLLLSVAGLATAEA